MKPKYKVNENRPDLEIWFVNKEDCIVKLTWFYPYNGWHKLFVKNGMTFEECKDKLPKIYGV